MGVRLSNPGDKITYIGNAPRGVQASGGGGAYPGWTRQSSVSINNTGNAATLTDYCVKVPVTYDAAMQADFDDIRFADGSTPLSYWLESKADSTSAVFWVKVPSIPASSTKVIQMYFGNALAASASDGDATFQLFDHFESAPAGVWTRHASNPLLSPAEVWEGNYCRDFHVIYNGPGDWQAWYWGNNQDLGYATSTDGVAWTKVGEINVNGVRPCVVKKDGTYYLYTNDETNIRLSTSSSPGSGFSAPSNVLTPTEVWEESKLKVPSVIYDPDDNTWKMWFSAAEFTPSGVAYTEPEKIGYATSPDGVTWTKHAGNPIVVAAADGSWLHGAIQGFEVVKIGSTYHAIYTGADRWGCARVGYTTSQSPTAWTLSRNDLILDTGPKGDFDQDFVYGSNPVNVDGALRTYYNGRLNATATEKIGLLEYSGVAVDDVLDTSKWWHSRAAILAVDSSASIVTLTSNPTTLNTAGIEHMLMSNDQFADCMVEARTRIKASPTDAYSAAMLEARFNGTYWEPITKSFGNQNQYSNGVFDGSTVGDRVGAFKRVNGAETQLDLDTVTIARDTWYVQGLALTGTSIRSFLDGTERYAGTDSGVTAAGFVALRNYQSAVDVDWIRVRKYSNPEPTASVV